jgi:hypothetical protein
MPDLEVESIQAITPHNPRSDCLLTGHRPRLERGGTSCLTKVNQTPQLGSAAEVHFSSPTLERRIYFVGAMKGVIQTRSPEAVIRQHHTRNCAPGHFQTHLLSLAVDRARRHL